MPRSRWPAQWLPQPLARRAIYPATQCPGPRTPQLFFIIAATVACIVNCGESIGIIFNTFLQNTGLSVNLTSTVLSFGVIMSGILSTDMPRVLWAINHVSPLKYAAQTLIPASLKGIEFTCENWQRLPSGRCPIETGEDVMQLYRLDGFVVWKNLVTLVGATLAYRILAYGILAGKRNNWRIGRG